MKKYNPDDLRELSKEELQDRLKDVNSQLMLMRTITQKATYEKGQPTVCMLKKVKRQLLTILGETI